MKNKILVLGIIILISIFSVGTAQAYTAYQEAANATSQTGAWILGFSGTNVYDSNYGTEGRATNSPTSYAYMNYTKPENAQSTTQWQVKDFLATVNMSIPAACWSQDPLQFRVTTTTGTNGLWQCYNATAWDTQRSVATNRWFEEGIFWEITPPVPEFSDLGWILAAVLGAGGFIFVRKRKPF